MCSICFLIKSNHALKAHCSTINIKNIGVGRKIFSFVKKILCICSEFKKKIDNHQDIFFPTKIFSQIFLFEMTGEKYIFRKSLRFILSNSRPKCQKTVYCSGISGILFHWIYCVARWTLNWIMNKKVNIFRNEYFRNFWV